METVLESVGSCGRFQVVFVLVSRAVSLLVSSWGLMFMAFGNFDPGWTCVRSVNGSSEVASHNLNESRHLGQAGSANGSDLRLDSTNSSAQPREAACSTFKSCESIVFNTDVSTIVTEWNLLCEDDWIPSLMISVQMAGVLLGAIGGGQFAERFGRRKCFYTGLVVQTVFNVVAAVSVSWQMFAASRFCLGTGIGVTFSVCHVFPNEFLDHKWRATLPGIPIWAVSMSVFAATVYLLQDWRHVHVMTALLALVALLPVFWTPESMRWLAMSGQIEEAVKVAEKVARFNRRPAPDRHMVRTIAEKEYEQQRNRIRYSFFALFSRQLWWRSVGVGMGWSILSLIYFSINFGVKSLSGNFYLNLFLFALVGIPSIMMVTPATRVLGRRWGAVTFYSLAFAACVAIVIIQLAVDDKQDSGFAITILALTTTIFLDAGWSVFTTTTVELFPTVVRTTAYGFVLGVARVGAMLAPFVYPKSSDTFYIYYACMGGLTVLCGLIALSYPETKGKPMPDSLNLKPFEKEKELEHTRNDQTLITES